MKPLLNQERNRWAFFESLKIGVQFANAAGTPFTKISEQEAETTYIDGVRRIYSFSPNSVIFFKTPAQV